MQSVPVSEKSGAGGLGRRTEVLSGKGRVGSEIERTDGRTGDPAEKEGGVGMRRLLVAQCRCSQK